MSQQSESSSLAPDAPAVVVEGRRYIGGFSLILTIVATVGPLAAFMGAAPLVFMLSGPGASGIYLIATVLMLLFAVGYLAMARRVGNSSGFIVFIGTAFGTRAGVAAAYVTLLTYPLLLSALYGVFSVFLHQTLLDLFGIDIPWGICAVAMIALVGVLAYNRLDFSAKVMGVLLLLALLAMAVLAAAIVFTGAHGNGFSFDGFSWQALVGPGFALAFLFALSSYGSVESAAVYWDDVRNPRRTITRAMYAAIVILGLFYVICTWAVGNAAGVADVQADALENPTGFIFVIADEYLGPIFTQALGILVVTSFFAVVLGFTNIVARYIASLGRVGVLPAGVGRARPKSGSPAVAVVVCTVVTLAVVLGFLIAGADPYAQLYTWLVAVATVGILVLMAASSLAVVVDSMRAKRRAGAWSNLIAPAISFLGFGIASVLSVMNFPALTASESLVNWLWLLVPAFAIVGFAVGVGGRSRSIDFRAIG